MEFLDFLVLGLYFVIILGVVIGAYKIFAYRSIWRDKPTLNINDINKDPHTYY